MKKYKSQGKVVDVSVNSKEENSLEFFLDFVQEFGLCTTYRVNKLEETCAFLLSSFSTLNP